MWTNPVRLKEGQVLNLYLNDNLSFEEDLLYKKENTRSSWEGFNGLDLLEELEFDQFRKFITYKKIKDLTKVYIIANSNLKLRIRLHLKPKAESILLTLLESIEIQSFISNLEEQKTFRLLVEFELLLEY